MKLALLSNVGVELVADLFRPDDEVWLPTGFGAWRQVCLAPPEDLRTFAPDLVALLIDATDESAELVANLRRALPGSAVVRVDLDDLADEIGPKFFDERLKVLAGCPWSLVGQRAIRDEIRRLAAIRSAPPKKVLAVDFDGVLWRGTLAEDGVGALEPSVGFQKGLLELKRRGILLVGLTKNDAADVARVWDDSRMVLAAEDFVAVRANWRAKAENLAEVADELNLATDAFVFADDNPGECAAMSAAHPDAAVVPVPEPTAAALRHLARLNFPDFGATDEDRSRTEKYRAEAQRRTAAKRLTLDDYLASLETVVDFHPARADETPRLAQLSARCNQFNVDPQRYSEAALRRILEDPQKSVFSVSVRDRFGDLGIVSLLVVEREGASARLVEWAMSCRAMNRRVEDETWRRLCEALRGRGVRRLAASVRPTDRNGPVRDLFSRLPPFC